MASTTLPQSVIYVRVSSSKQMTEGDGLRSQEKRCRDYAESKGYEVKEVFADGISGAAEDRRAMNEMLAFLERQNREVIVIVDDLKRFARDVMTHFDLKAEIYARGGRMESPLFRFEDTPEGRFIETVTAAQAELERNQNRRQVLNRMKARLEQGYWTFQQPPGYRYQHDPVHKKMLVLDEPHASLAKEALEGYASGRLGSVAEVYRYLNGNAFFSTKRSKDPTRHLMQVHRMLRQVLYSGYLEYHPWGIALRPAIHPGLISLDCFQTIQERLIGRAKPIMRKDTSEDFPLRGFVQCGECGRSLTGSWPRGKRKAYAYYHCCNRGCALYGRNVAKDTMEGQFGQLLQNMRVNPATLDLARLLLNDAWENACAQHKEASESHKRRLRVIEEELSNLAERIAHTKSEIVAAALEQHIEELAHERLSVHEKMRHLNDPHIHVGTLFDSVRFLLENPFQTWNEGTLQQKRVVSRLAFPGSLRYYLKQGFGTPEYGVPYLLLKRLENGNTVLVDAALKSWNTPKEIRAGQTDLLECIKTLQAWQAALDMPRATLVAMTSLCLFAAIIANYAQICTLL